jgi:protein O-GlcNAc transferase
VYPVCLQQRFRKSFPSSVDISAQVVFLPSMHRSAFLSLIAASDVVLDPFPFGGGVTTLEALSVGSIVVTAPTQVSVLQVVAILYYFCCRISPPACCAYWLIINYLKLLLI